MQKKEKIKTVWGVTHTDSLVNNKINKKDSNISLKN